MARCSEIARREIGRRISFLKAQIETLRAQRRRSRRQRKQAYVTGRKVTYVDLSLFQIVAGLRYAFPKHMNAYEHEIPALVDLHDRVAARPNIEAYLASDRRVPFNEDGIFRRYKALDA